MRYVKISIMILLLTALSAMTAQAKWWIFGQSKDEVSIRYLFLNKISFDEINTKITVYKETLQDGMIHIRGKARVKHGKIAEVRITLDGKETWHKAALSEDGAFSFSFAPEIGKTYVVYVEIMDTRGKTNDVEATRKEVTISGENLLAVIKATLDAMVNAYMNEDPRTFMAYVSENFAGDDTVLDRAIRRDFSAFENIDLRYTLGTVATDPKGMIFVSINFNRLVVSAKDGRSYTDRGTTEFVFELGEKHPLVYSMKNPLIFGLSLAGEVATGTVQQPSNAPIIIVDDRGNVDVKPFDKAIDIINGGDDSSDAGDVESGTNVVIRFPVLGHPPGGFTFADGTVDTSGDFTLTGQCSPDSAYGFLKSGVLIQDLGMGASLNDLTEAPASGYTNTTVPPGFAGAICLTEDHLYAFQLPGPKYAALYVRSVDVGPMPDGYITVRIDYKYQPNGTRKL